MLFQGTELIDLEMIHNNPIDKKKLSFLINETIEVIKECSEDKVKLIKLLGDTSISEDVMIYLFSLQKEYLIDNFSFLLDLLSHNFIYKDNVITREGFISIVNAELVKSNKSKFLENFSKNCYLFFIGLTEKMWLIDISEKVAEDEVLVTII